MFLTNKKTSIVMAMFISFSAITMSSNAEAWDWFVAKKLLKPSKPETQSKSWWEDEGKYSKGWSADESDPDWKMLDYREKDWYD